MDLEKVFKENIANLVNSSEIDIIHHLYIETGRMFIFSPICLLDSTFTNFPIIDINNVTDFNINCKTWSLMFVDLLKVFNIEAKVKSYDYLLHYWVEVINPNLELDITATKFMDLTRIKFGFKTINNIDYQSVNKDNYIKFLKATILKSKKKDNKWKFVLSIIESEINKKNQNNIGFICCRQYINYLFEYFLDTIVFSTTFYDDIENIFIEVYPITINKETKYYVLKKNNNGCYEFHEESYNNVVNMKIIYCSKDIKNLTLG